MMVKMEVADQLGILTLNRPEVHHAINQKVMEQLEDALEELEPNDRVKMIILTGEGEESFCSGGDIQEFHQMDQSEVSEVMHGMKRLLHRLQCFSKPTLAALNGTAVGGGCEIASACDFRAAHEQVMLGFIQIRLGITTGWGGSSRFFQLVPHNKVMKWLLSGQKYTAQEAYEIGFVDEIFAQDQFMEDVLRWCRQFTRHSLPALKAYKATLVDRWQADPTWSSRIDAEVERCLELWGSAEHKQKVESFLRRKNSKS